MSGVRDAHQGARLYQLSISNNRATFAGTVRLAKAGQSLFWIHDGTVFQSYWKLIHNKNAAIATWPYPQGGKPTALLYGVSKGRNANIGDITFFRGPVALGDNDANVTLCGFHADARDACGMRRADRSRSASRQITARSTVRWILERTALR